MDRFAAALSYERTAESSRLRAGPTVFADEKRGNPRRGAVAGKREQGKAEVVAKEGRAVLAEVGDDVA